MLMQVVTGKGHNISWMSPGSKKICTLHECNLPSSNWSWKNGPPWMEPRVVVNNCHICERRNNTRKLVDNCRHCVTHLVRIPGRRFSINGADLFPFENSMVITFRYKCVCILNTLAQGGNHHPVIKLCKIQWNVRTKCSMWIASLCPRWLYNNTQVII